MNRKSGPWLGLPPTKPKSGAIGELLVLLSQKASHEVLTQEVEALHSHIHSMFSKPSSKK